MTFAEWKEPWKMTKGYDLIIRNAQIFDGSGGPWYRADIAVRDGVIAGIGKIDGCGEGECIDAEGMAVAPGFIDPHCHSDCNCITVCDADGKITQ